MSWEWRRAQNCWDRILFGPRHVKFDALVTEQLKRAVDEQVGSFKMLMPMAVGSREYVAAKQHMAEAFIREMPNVVGATYAYSQEALGMEELIRTRLQALPSEEFEGVLHPVFEEDEWKLIAVGGLLGGIVGIFQTVFVFGDA